VPPFKRLLKKSTSGINRKITPPHVVGAGVVGITNGDGVLKYNITLFRNPTTNTAAAIYARRLKTLLSPPILKPPFK